jgi:hypothetical protein
MKKILLGALTATLLVTNASANFVDGLIDMEIRKQGYEKIESAVINNFAKEINWFDRESKLDNNRADINEIGIVRSSREENGFEKFIINSVKYSKFIYAESDFYKRHATDPKYDFSEFYANKIYTNVFIPKCSEYINLYVGRSLSLNLGDKTGLRHSFSTKEICANYNSYLQHIKDKDKLQLSFATLVSKPSQENFNFIKAMNSDKIEAQAFGLIGYLEKGTTTIKRFSIDRFETLYSPMFFIKEYYNNFNHSTYSKVGGRSVKLQSFLSSIFSHDFYKADKILKNNIKNSEKIVKKAKWLLFNTTLYKRN